MRNTIIESLGVYLPPKVVSTSEVLKGCRTNLAFPLERLTGIKSRRMAGETEFSIDLGRNAIESCLKCSRYGAEDIELLICCNISRYDGPSFEFSLEPSTSVRLKDHFGMDAALCFDLSNACAGMFTGILIADCYLRAGMVQNALVVSGEYITHLTETAQKEIAGMHDPRMACLTLGDAGAAVVLERGADDSAGFHDIEMYTLSRYSDLCVGKATDREHGGAIMLTQSHKIQDVAMGASVVQVLGMLRKRRWPRNGFHLLTHQTARTTIAESVRQLNKMSGTDICDNSNAINNLEQRGNTASTAHIVAVWDSILKNRIRPMDDVLFAIQASGVTIGAASYTFDDLPQRLRSAVLGQETTEKAHARTERVVPRPEPACEAPARIQIESFGTVRNGCAPQDAVELARIAAEDCLRTSAHDRSQIDVFAHAGVHRDEFLCEPALGAIIAGRLKVNDVIAPAQQAKTLAFDVSNGALGFLNACHTATAMIRASKYRRIMIVASEIENNAQVLPERLLGIKETASALILERSSNGRRGFDGFLFKSFTEYIDSFRSYIGQEKGKSFLAFTKDPNVESLYLKCISNTVHELLEKEGLELSEIKIVFPPQISSEFIGQLARRLNVPRDRCVDLAQEGKDFFTSSLAFAMQYAREHDLAQPGDIGLIVNVGTGIQIGCAVYYF